MKPPRPLDDLLRTLLARYATVRPDGLVLDPRAPPVTDVMAKLVRSGAARTLYRDKQPDCRSLDGVKSLKGRECATCPERSGCTPQILVDLEIDRLPYRLLLSFTSAKNFLLAVDRLRRESRPLEGAHLRVRVVNRGRWGEVCFEVAPA
jgi:hypothetical protein